MDIEIRRQGEDSFASSEVNGILARRWRETWDVMIDRNPETPHPGARSAQRGMRFCLIVLVLRYGLASGHLKNGGKRVYPDGQERERQIDTGVSFREASEAASLLLAVSVLHRNNEKGSVLHVPWDTVEKHAAIMRSSEGRQAANKLGIADLEDFKRKGIGLAGFRKLLREMPPMEWGEVSRLAAEYQKQAGKFDQWMKKEQLVRWFPLAGS